MNLLIVNGFIQDQLNIFIVSVLDGWCGDENCILRAAWNYLLTERKVKTRMHSNRMRTTRGSSGHGGASTSNPPPEQAPRADTPTPIPGVGLEPPPPARPLNFLLGCVPGNLQGMLGYPPGRLAARHAGIPPANHAGIRTHPSLDRMTDMCKNITFANFVWGR